MTEQSTRHATASDLPGWPTPPRVRDIPNVENSWGWILVAQGQATRPSSFGAVFQDEIGRLWVDGDRVPRYRHLAETDANPGAYVYWTESGLGLYIDPKSYESLGDISSLDMQPDRWIPVAEVARDLPPFAKKD